MKSQYIVVDVSKQVNMADLENNNVNEIVEEIRKIEISEPGTTLRLDDVLEIVKQRLQDEDLPPALLQMAIETLYMDNVHPTQWNRVKPDNVVFDEKRVHSLIERKIPEVKQLIEDLHRQNAN